MKWPAQLTLIRHAASAYNALKLEMQADELYQEFTQLYKFEGLSPSVKLIAKELHHRYPASISDSDTPLAEGAVAHAYQVGQSMQQQMDLPDVIYVSPYRRTEDTLKALYQGWPALTGVRVLQEERIREQEFGLRLLYSDWRFFFALHPEQYHLHQLSGSYWYRYPQGENVPDVRSRNRSWMITLTRDFAEQRILAVTHHLTILALRANMERLSEQQFLELDRTERPQNCSLTIYRGDPDQGDEGRFVLEHYNQAVIE